MPSLERPDGRTLAEDLAPGVRVPAPSRAVANVATLITQNSTARGWHELETEPSQGPPIGSRTRAFMFGGILAASGGAGLYTETTHYLRATPVTATILERRKECTVEYQIIGKERTRTPMSCDAAEALQNRAGANKIKINRTDLSGCAFSLPTAVNTKRRSTSSISAPIASRSAPNLRLPTIPAIPTRCEPLWPGSCENSAWPHRRRPWHSCSWLPGTHPERVPLAPRIPPDNDALPTAARLAVNAKLPISANEGSAQTPRRPTVVGSRGGQPSSKSRTSFGTR